MVPCSVADPDPGSGAFLPPGLGSGIRNRFFTDPGSQTHIFDRLMTIFWVESSIILCKLAQNVIFVATKKVHMTTNFFHPSLLLLFLDPGSKIRDGQKSG